MSTSSKIKSWMGPSPSDKYLPIWVIVIMFVCVLALSAQMTSVISAVCKLPNRCHPATAVRMNVAVPGAGAESALKAAETAAAEAVAAAASASASAAASAPAK